MFLIHHLIISACFFSVMASLGSVVDDFDRALSYGLRRLGRPDMVLKPEQKASIRHVYDGKDVFMWLPTGFGKSMLRSFAVYV